MRAVLSAIVCAALVQSAWPASIIDLLVGTWKEDQAKRKLSFPDLRFERTSSGNIEELRGPVEKPISEPVHFDGKPYPLTSGSTITWKQIDSNNYQGTLSHNGHVLVTRTIKLSSDGNTMTEQRESKLPNGKTETNTIVADRSTGAPNGLVGRWVVKSFRTSDPLEMTYDRTGTSGIKYSIPEGATYTAMLDGKPVPYTGPTVLPGITLALTEVDDHTMRATWRREGVVFQETKSTVSPDGKTLTQTITSKQGPSVTVYQKQ